MLGRRPRGRRLVGRPRGTGEFWGDGSPHPVGQGASAHGDGANLLHHIEAATRFAPMEVWEARNPWLMERFELAPDSGGPGQPGRSRARHVLPLPRGLLLHVDHRAHEARPMGAGRRAAGPPERGLTCSCRTVTRTFVGKATGLRIPKGATFEIHCGGGGGYGPPSERDPELVRADVREGYVTEAHARHYPHAFDS